MNKNFDYSRLGAGIKNLVDYKKYLGARYWYKTIYSEPSLEFVEIEVYYFRDMGKYLVQVNGHDYGGLETTDVEYQNISSTVQEIVLVEQEIKIIINQKRLMEILLNR